MKKLVLSLVLLMMVIGVTVGVLNFLELGPFEKTAEEKQEQEQQTIEEEIRLVDLDPLVVSIFDGDKVAATIQIQLKLETLGTDNSIKVNRIKTKLSSEFLKELHAYLPRMLRKQERLDINLLKTRLLMVADRVTEPHLVRDVLVQSVNQKQGR